MALDVKDIRDAIAEKLGDNWNPAHFRCNVYAYPPEAPEPTCALIRLAGGDQCIDYHGTFGISGMVSVRLEIEVRVVGWDIDAAKLIDNVLSTGTAQSLYDALAVNNYALATDGNPVTVHIESATQPQRVIAADGAMTYMSCRFMILAYTQRG
jgi:hypothetical protein